MIPRYKENYTNYFLDDLKTIKKDKVLLDRLHKKINQIIENPGHYPLKRHNLRGKRSAHIGCYVVLFEIMGDAILFHRFKHHDHVYK